MIYLLAIMLAAQTAQTAQTAPAAPPVATPTPVSPASTAKFTLDTPIETLVADPAAKAVLATDLQTDLTANPSYDMFKAMSFNQVAAYAPDKLTPDVLKKLATDLSAIK